MKAKEKITKSSGNVFIDLGFPPEEAEILALRSSLMCELERLIAGAALDAGGSRKNPRYRPIARIRPGARQVG